jgi:hypothetical protein
MIVVGEDVSSSNLRHWDRPIYIGFYGFRLHILAEIYATSAAHFPPTRSLGRRRARKFEPPMAMKMLDRKGSSFYVCDNFSLRQHLPAILWRTKW